MIPLEWIPIDRVPTDWIPAGWIPPGWLSTRGAAEPAPAAASASASAVASASASASAPEPSLQERAAQGDQAALAELAERPADQLSIEEALALARGREAQQRSRVTELEERLKEDRTLAERKETVEELLKFAGDARTAPEALRIIAELPGPIGPDLLHRMWTTSSSGNQDTAELAERLLLGPSVRERASDALAVALDLRQTKECKAVAAILPRAIEHGDIRSFRPLVGLLVIRGCGTSQADDCYPCLRYGNAKNQLRAALRVTQKRPSPKW
jgi:hypothetical protein